MSQSCAHVQLLLLHTVCALALLLLVLAVLPAHVDAAWGVTTTSAAYTIDTGASTVFSIRRQHLSNQKHIGDISSLRLNGREMQDQQIGSQINSGASATSTLSLDTSVANIIKVTLTDVDQGFTHYYLAKNGDPTVYMATYITKSINVRYIARLSKSALPNGPTPSDISATTKTIEAGDIFAMPNGQTRSKHYSNQRQMDWWSIGATGAGVGAFLVKGNNEGFSGGPFYRSLINQGGEDQELYIIMNYGEGNTEAFRLQNLNMYALVFTNGGQPGSLDFGFFGSLNLLGYAGASSRGHVLGVGVNPFKSGVQYVIGFANAAAQYWTTVAPNGRYGCYGMRAGTYTMTIYKNELAVFSQSITVIAGQSQQLHTITYTDPSDTPALWRIGTWDGTPNEFLNGDKLTTMHPSDPRMANWGPITFNANTDAASSFPAVQFRGANSPTTITFTLTAAQAAVARTLSIGITTAYSNGRPAPSVNGNALQLRAASAQPNTRTITVGTYRGNNAKFSWAIPARFFVAGTNTITISPISGNSDMGAYLSASYTYDVIELVA